MSQLLQTLKTYWGYTSFRGNQEKIVTSVLQGKDVLAVLATGSGKSICYQLPALMNQGVCIVISPLIALIVDQVKELKQLKIKADYIPAGSFRAEVLRILDNVQFGGVKFLYLSPERLQSKLVQDKLQTLQVSLLAVDEAHCISEWGHDFRPAYRSIHILRNIFPKTNCIALTGTATKKVAKDILQNLELKEANIYHESLLKDNLSYRVIFTENKAGKLLEILQKIKEPAIVYCNSRNKTENISRFLHANGISSCSYHAGINQKGKQLAFEQWMNESRKVMVATTAFGMGINKKNVRTVIHLDIPSSIENYVQQVGRAGRDYQHSYGFLLTNENDILLFNENSQNGNPTLKELKEIYIKLFQFFSISMGEQTEENYYFNYLDFSSTYNFYPKKVLTSLQILQTNGIIEFSSNQFEKSSIQFICTSKSVINYAIRNIYIKRFIDSLLRNYSGLYKQKVYIDELQLAKQNQITSDGVFAYLKQLESDKIISYWPQKQGTKIRFLHPREDDYTINRISKEIKSYVRQKKIKSQEIINFINIKNVCRSIQIARYFDEKKPQKCEKCDVCLRKKRAQDNNISTRIIQLLQKQKELSSMELCSAIEADEKMILIHLQELLSAKKICLNSSNKYRLHD